MQAFEKVREEPPHRRFLHLNPTIPPEILETYHFTMFEGTEIHLKLTEKAA